MGEKIDILEKLAMLEEEVISEIKEKNKREMPEKFGLVLAGGGGKGAYQVGVLRAMAERGLLERICGISGASVGAINALLYIMGNIELSENVWNEVSYGNMLKFNPEMIDFKEGLFERNPLVELMDQYVDFGMISGVKYPFYVSTTEVKNDIDLVPKYFKINNCTKSQITDLILASSALPLVYENVVYDGSILKDGGITDNYPIRPLYDEGIRKFIVVQMTEKIEINTSHYDDAEFIVIKPFKSIGGLMDGTLDFTKNGVKYRMELGYIDAVRELDNILAGGIHSQEFLDITAESEYNSIERKYKHQNSIGTAYSTIEKINEIEKMY